MSLIGNCYTNPSSSDPGSVGFGYLWAQSDTGSLYWRNTSNTAWVLSGNVNQTYLGQLSRAGGTMTGAILGAHGLMPVAGGDFTVAPTILGDAIATVPYVNTQMDDLRAQLNVQIAQAIASIPGLSVSSKLAIGIGSSGPITFTGSPIGTGYYTVPLPVYGDGTTAGPGDVVGRYWAWPQNFAVESGSTGTPTVQLAESPANSRIFVLTQNASTTGVTVPATPWAIGYIIIGVKS